MLSLYYPFTLLGRFLIDSRNFAVCSAVNFNCFCKPFAFLAMSVVLCVPRGIINCGDSDQQAAYQAHFLHASSL